MDTTLLAKNSQHCWILHVASFCTACCMLLHFVGSCCAKFEIGQILPTFPLFRDRRSLFSFHKRSLLFLTVDATIGNQAFTHDGCNIFPGLSYNKVNSTFLNSFRKNKVEAQVKFTIKIMERARVACYCITVKKNISLVYVLNFFGILAGRCGNVIIN